MKNVTSVQWFPICLTQAAPKYKLYKTLNLGFSVCSKFELTVVQQTRIKKVKGSRM